MSDPLPDWAIDRTLSLGTIFDLSDERPPEGLFELQFICTLKSPFGADEDFEAYWRRYDYRKSFFRMAGHLQKKSAMAEEYASLQWTCPLCTSPNVRFPTAATFTMQLLITMVWEIMQKVRDSPDVDILEGRERALVLGVMSDHLNYFVNAPLSRTSDFVTAFVDLADELASLERIEELGEVLFHCMNLAYPRDADESSVREAFMKAVKAWKNTTGGAGKSYAKPFQDLLKALKLSRLDEEKVRAVRQKNRKNKKTVSYR
jgi:hypothetical protein